LKRMARCYDHSQLREKIKMFFAENFVPDRPTALDARCLAA